MTKAVREKVKLRVMECPHCKGPLVRSKSFAFGGQFLSWSKPWQSWLKMSVPMWAWACMRCGKVTFFLKESASVTSEFNTMVEDGSIELAWVDDAEEGGETSETEDEGRQGGFRRIR